MQKQRECDVDVTYMQTHTYTYLHNNVFFLSILNRLQYHQQNMMRIFWNEVQYKERYHVSQYILFTSVKIKNSKFESKNKIHTNYIQIIWQLFGSLQFWEVYVMKSAYLDVKYRYYSVSQKLSTLCMYNLFVIFRNFFWIKVVALIEL